MPLLHRLCERKDHSSCTDQMIVQVSGKQDHHQGCEKPFIWTGSIADPTDASCMMTCPCCPCRALSIGSSLVSRQTTADHITQVTL